MLYFCQPIERGLGQRLRRKGKIPLAHEQKVGSRNRTEMCTCADEPGFDLKERSRGHFARTASGPSLSHIVSLLFRMAVLSFGMETTGIEPVGCSAWPTEGSSKLGQ